MFAVLLPKRLLRRSHLRIVDFIILQRVIHCLTTSSNGYLRSVHLSKAVGSVPTIIPDRTEEHFLQDAFLFLMGRQRLLPLTNTVYRFRINLVE